MCKLLIVTGIQDSPMALEFMRRMSVPMSKTNAHGIGYTAVDSKGEMFSERWHNNYSFMDYDTIMTPSVAKKLAAYANRLPVGALSPNYSKYGNIDFNDMKTLTMHTRWATCGREFANTHPFIDGDTSLIHNGSIRNADYLKVNKISTCDSEAALQTYISEGVALDSKQAKKWLNILTGSWAFGILSRGIDNLRLLDVVRGTSSLYYMEIEGVGKVFATDSDDVKLVAKDMNLTFTMTPGYVSMDTMYRFNAVTGDLIEEVDIKAKVVTTGYTGNPNWQHGRNGSSHSNPQTNRATLGKNQTNPRTIMFGSGEHDDLESPFPDLLTRMGKWDYNKITKYLNDTDEPFVDRLDIFDKVYTRNLVSQFNSLTSNCQDFVEELDLSRSFKDARGLIVELTYKRNNGKVV